MGNGIVEDRARVNRRSKVFSHELGERAAAEAEGRCEGRAGSFVVCTSAVRVFGVQNGGGVWRFAPLAWGAIFLSILVRFATNCEIAAE